MSRNALIVGNDHATAACIKELLEKEGFGLVAFLRMENRAEAHAAIRKGRPDLVVLDIETFDRSGFEACREIRAVHDDLMIVLMDREEDLNQVMVFELGADDVVTKPFSKRVLQARLRAHLRNMGRMTGRGQAGSISIGDLTVHPDRREAFLKGRQLELTTLLFDLLWYLVRNAGCVVTRDDLCRAVLETGYNGVDRSIDVYISRLRRKLEDDPVRPCYLKTVRGEGYLLAAVSAGP